MKKTWYLAGLAALFGGTALAADPTGNRLVNDRTASIRVAPCGGAYCGTIAWTSQPGLDENNPDPSKRNHPIVGTQILLAMKPAGDRWEGQIYNVKDGRTYTSNMSLKSADVLRVEGCAFGGWFCGGQNWTRAKDARQG